MKKIFFLILAVLFLGIGCKSEAPPQNDQTAPLLSTQIPIGTYVTVAQGQRLSVGVLTVEVRSVVSRTAEGCEGGPTGCPDTITLAASGAGIIQEFTLAVLGGSQSIASSERIVLGHRFVLSLIANNSATIAVFIAEPPTAQ